MIGRPRSERLAETQPKSPLMNATFRWFFLGRVVSVLGSAMTPVALAFAVLLVPGGTHLLGSVLAAEMVPMLAFLVLGGGVADRYRRDTVLRLTNVGAGLSQAGIAFCVLTESCPPSDPPGIRKRDPPGVLESDAAGHCSAAGR